MKIYLLVEHTDHGRGYGLYRNLRPYTSKELAEKVKNRLNAAEKALYSQEEIDHGLYYESYHIEEHELVTSETVH